MRDDAEQVILVDAEDREIGREAKLPAHQRGQMHRAISVSVTDSSGRMLLQRRAAGKYHSGGLWTNACCSHPRPGEGAEQAAMRRLQEELGFVCPLKFAFRAHYSSPVDRGLIENEVVHIFRGVYDGPMSPDPVEVEATKWRPREALLAELAANPGDFTVWFKHYVRNFADLLF